jgi:hypothetical protein
VERAAECFGADEAYSIEKLGKVLEYAIRGCRLRECESEEIRYI